MDSDKLGNGKSTEVLEHFTSASRWFLGGTDDDLLGTLEVGRLGDVVVHSGGIQYRA